MEDSLTLNEWIQIVGKEKAISSLKTTRTNVYNWLHFISCPRPKILVRAVSVSKGLVSIDKTVQIYVKNIS